MLSVSTEYTPRHLQRTRLKPISDSVILSYNKGLSFRTYS